MNEWQRQYGESIAKAATADAEALAHATPTRKAALGGMVAFGTILRLIVLPVYVVLIVGLLLDPSMDHVLLSLGLVGLMSLSIFRTTDSSDGVVPRTRAS